MPQRDILLHATYKGVWQPGDFVNVTTVQTMQFNPLRSAFQMISVINNNKSYNINTYIHTHLYIKIYILCIYIVPIKGARRDLDIMQLCDVR